MSYKMAISFYSRLALQRAKLYNSINENIGEFMRSDLRLFVTGKQALMLVARKPYLRYLEIGKHSSSYGLLVIELYMRSIGQLS